MLEDEVDEVSVVVVEVEAETILYTALIVTSMDTLISFVGLSQKRSIMQRRMKNMMNSCLWLERMQRGLEVIFGTLITAVHITLHETNPNLEIWMNL